MRAYLAPFSNLADNLFGIVKRPDASTSAADWTTGGGTLSPDNGDGRRVADGYALRSRLSSFSQFSIGQATTSTPLPVTLVSFRAVAQGAAAQLTWAVAQEIGISRYEIERSLDGRSFQLVGQVAARGGASTSYTYLDAPLGQTTGLQQVYYCLRILEPNQPTTFSPVVVLSYSAAGTTLVAWPTVFSTELHLDGTTLREDLQRAELLDAQGRVVYTQALPAGSRGTTLSGQRASTCCAWLRPPSSISSAWCGSSPPGWPDNHLELIFNYLPKAYLLITND